MPAEITLAQLRLLTTAFEFRLASVDFDLTTEYGQNVSRFVCDKWAETLSFILGTPPYDGWDIKCPSEAIFSAWNNWNPARHSESERLASLTEAVQKHWPEYFDSEPKCEKVLPWSRHANDLYVRHNCPHCGKQIKETGYHDSHFFDKVNEKPYDCNCPGCYVKYDRQWKRDGLHVVWHGKESRILGTSGEMIIDEF